MRHLLSLAAVCAGLFLVACGGDDETTSTISGASGATGAQGVSGDDLTASEFIDASIPDQLKEIEDLVAANPGCADVEVKPGGDFQVGVSINAAQATPETPLSEIVADQCGQG